MKINTCNYIQPIKRYSYPKNYANFDKKNSPQPSFGKRDEFKSFFRNIYNEFFSSPVNSFIPVYYNEKPSEYAQKLSKGMLGLFEKNIPAENLKNIMSPDEFRELLPSLTSENFIYSKRNEDQGIYLADLDNQTNYSSGADNIFALLEKANNYANDYYKKNQKDFIFAIADRDALGGVQQAIRLIGENPEKYKHLKLLPAIKLTFAHEAPNSKLKYENSEMLVYGINPFSRDLNQFIDVIIQKRRTMSLNFIREISKLYPEFAYNIIEFAEQNRLKYYSDYTVSNLYWRAREYAETKGDTVIKTEHIDQQKIYDEAQAILDELDKLYVGSNSDGLSSVTSSIIDEKSDLNLSIKKVFTEFSTHKTKGGELTSSAENFYEDIINCLDKEPQKPVIALSSPYYLTHYFKKNKSLENTKDFISELKEKSKGMLCAFESVSPAYNKDKYLPTDTIKKFNNYLRTQLGLYEVGGSFETRNK